MIRIKVKLHPGSSPCHPATIQYLVTYNNTTRKIPSSITIKPSDWDFKTNTVRSDYTRTDTSVGGEIRQNIRMDIQRLTNIAKLLENNETVFFANDIADEYNRYMRRGSIFNFMAHTIQSLYNNGQTRTAETYASSLNSFKAFRQGNDIMMDRINTTLIQSYQTWLRRKGLVPNTTSFYIRILRATYNRAVAEHLTPDHKPFTHAYTGVAKTVKRALSRSAIRRIRELDLSSQPSLEYARDMFILSFYLRGMSFVDMAYLLKTDLNNGYIRYRRRKTGQILSIALTREMQTIIARYSIESSRYMLPIIRNDTANPRNAYRNAGYCINSNLKKVAGLAGIDISLTLYVARHSWASVARDNGVPINVISQGMGHDNENTTRIYLTTLDTTLIDRANSLVISSI